MPTRRRQPIPVTFPGLPEPIRTELERFARTVDEQIAENLRDDVRPLEGSSEPLGAGGVYVVDPGTSPVDRELPALDAEDAGASITFVRRDVGTAIVRAIAPATISGQPLAHIPPRLGAYEIVYDGSSWFFKTAPGLVQRNEWSADQLRGGPFPASVGVSGSATLIADPVFTGINVRGFRPLEGVRREFTIPTGVSADLKLRSYFRAQSGPSGTAVVSRMLRARQYADGSGIPSGWAVFTLPTVTMPSGASRWTYREDSIPVGALGLTGGRVEVVFSRGAAAPGELQSMLLVESLVLEVEA